MSWKFVMADRKQAERAGMLEHLVERYDYAMERMRKERKTWSVEMKITLTPSGNAYRVDYAVDCGAVEVEGNEDAAE